MSTEAGAGGAAGDAEVVTSTMTLTEIRDKAASDVAAAAMHVEAALAGVSGAQRKVDRATEDLAGAEAAVTEANAAHDRATATYDDALNALKALGAEGSN